MLKKKKTDKYRLKLGEPVKAHEFYKIRPVPSAENLVDIVLHRVATRTQNAIHPSTGLLRMRKLFSNKVLRARNEYCDRLQRALSDFPKVDVLPPFYAALVSVLYDKDAFKVALGALARTQGVLERAATNFLKLLRYADAPFACKRLKTAALGQMSKAVRRLKEPLSFLEQVRKHLSRLPRVDLQVPSAVLCGAPNVGKSTLLRRLTGAQTEVEAYPFTTKALFRGMLRVAEGEHTGIYQLLDSPGLLDRPFVERNAVEMQTVAALGHLSGVVVFLLDGSGLNALDTEGQLKLFEELAPLFAEKQKVFLITKTDVRSSAAFSAAEQEALRKTVEKHCVSKVVECSPETPLSDLVTLFAEAVGKLPEERPTKEKPPVKVFVPDNVSVVKNAFKPVGVPQPSLLEKEEKAGGVGVVETHLRDYHCLDNSEWQYDLVPEIYNGENVADFHASNNREKLERLKEEDKTYQARFDSVREELEPSLCDEEFVELKKRHREAKENKLLNRAKKIIGNKKSVVKKNLVKKARKKY